MFSILQLSRKCCTFPCSETRMCIWNGTMSNKVMTQILKVKLAATKSEVLKLSVKYRMVPVHTKDAIRWKRKLQQLTLTFRQYLSISFGSFFEHLYIRNDSDVSKDASYFPPLTHFSLPIKTKSSRNSLSWLA